MRSRTPGRTLKTTKTTFAVLEALRDLRGGRVTEVADHLDLTKSSVNYHLITMEELGYVVRDGDEYHIGLKFANLGEYAQHRDPCYQAAVRKTWEIDERINFETDFVVEENGVGRYLKPVAKSVSDLDRYPQVGERIHLHSTACGKALLATFSEEKVDKIIDYWGLPAKTEKTITTRDELLAELDRVREQGYATNCGEHNENIRAVAQVVHRPNGTVLGSISIGGPKYRTKEDVFDGHAADSLSSFVEDIEDELQKVHRSKAL